MSLTPVCDNHPTRKRVIEFRWYDGHGIRSRSWNPMHLCRECEREMFHDWDISWEIGMEEGVEGFWWEYHSPRCDVTYHDEYHRSLLTNPASTWNPVVAARLDYSGQPNQP